MIFSDDTNVTVLFPPVFLFKYWVEAKFTICVSHIMRGAFGNVDLEDESMGLSDKREAVLGNLLFIHVFQEQFFISITLNQYALWC